MDVLLWYCFFLDFRCWVTRQLNEVGRWVAWYGWCVYIASIGNGSLDAILVDGDRIGLNAHDARRHGAVWQELVECAGGWMVCILTFGGDQWKSNKKLYTQTVCKLMFWVQGAHNLFCIAVATFLHEFLGSVAKCGCGLLSMLERLAKMFCRGC